MYVNDPSSSALLHRKTKRRDGEVSHDESAIAEITKSAQGMSPVSGDRLDMHDAKEVHRRLLATYAFELERQQTNRAEMAVDEDMFDHMQWSDEEIAALLARGQTPTVFNLIATTINWVLGSQRRSVTDHKVLPRRAEGSKAAQRKGELLRHLRDENDSETQVSKAYADAVKVGVGWLETGEGDPADGPTVFDRHESWRNILWDSRGKRDDLSDARYVCRVKWLDLDLAEAMWPNRAGLLRQSTEQQIMLAGMAEFGDEAMDAREEDPGTVSPVTAAGEHFRNRIRVIEMWYRKPMRVQVMSGGDFGREIFDPWSDGHWSDLDEGRAKLVTRPREVVHVACFTEVGLLELRQSPYRHNQFPFTPVWGYRRGRDGMPYGMIRGLRDIQRDLNKRASKALHYLSSTRVEVEEGAVDDLEELRDEAGRPDAVIVYKQGKQPPSITTESNLADAHVNLMQIDAQMIQQVGGVTDENLGRKTNAVSGAAITARQEQGSLATSTFPDNLRASLIKHGTKKLVNVEQFYTEKQMFRITNDRGNPDFVTINDGQIENAISKFKADFVMAEEDWRATARQSQADNLLQLMSQLSATAPQLIMQILDLIVEATDLPKRDELVKRIRQITGVSDPDEDPKNPSPETLAQQAAAQEQQQIQKRLMMAEISEKEGKAAKAQSDAARNWLGLRSDNLDQIQQAIGAALDLSGAPGVAAAVDALMMAATEEAYRLGQDAKASLIEEPQQRHVDAMPDLAPMNDQTPQPAANGVPQQ